MGLGPGSPAHGAWHMGPGSGSPAHGTGPRVPGLGTSPQGPRVLLILSCDPPAARGSDLGCVLVDPRGLRLCRVPPAPGPVTAHLSLCGSHTGTAWQPHKDCCCRTTAQLWLFNNHEASCCSATAQLWLLNSQCKQQGMRSRTRQHKYRSEQ